MTQKINEGMAYGQKMYDIVIKPFRFEVIKDVSGVLLEKHALVSLIMMVVFPFFALSSFFSFSIVGFASGVLYSSVTYGLLQGIKEIGLPIFLGNVWLGLADLFKGVRAPS